MESNVLALFKMIIEYLVRGVEFAAALISSHRCSTSDLAVPPSFLRSGWTAGGEGRCPAHIRALVGCSAGVRVGSRRAEHHRYS